MDGWIDVESFMKLCTGQAEIELVQRIFECDDMQNTRLTPDTERNSLIH